VTSKMLSWVKEETSKEHKPAICWWQDETVAQCKCRHQNVWEIWCTYLDRAADCIWKMLLTYKVNKMVFLKTV
jgi:hypothetical protein